MSRIEELSTLVKNQTTLVDNLESLIEKERLLKTRYANELFEATKALEAQERRPREFIIGVDKNGYPVSVGKYGTGILHHVSSGALLPEMYITVIEKLPVKVTREIVAKLQKAYWGCVVPLDGMGLWVDVLKAAGIDAEPSND